MGHDDTTTVFLPWLKARIKIIEADVEDPMKAMLTVANTWQRRAERAEDLLSNYQRNCVYLIFRNDQIYGAYIDPDFRDLEFERLMNEDKEQQHTWATTSAKVFLENK